MCMWIYGRYNKPTQYGGARSPEHGLRKVAGHYKQFKGIGFMVESRRV